MTTTCPVPVVVAVPHDGVDSALRFAAREGLLRGCPVRVVGPTISSHRGRPDLLAAAVATVELLGGPGLTVDARTLPEADVEEVIADSPDGSLVVVHRSGVLRLLHAISYGVAGSQARSDVVCVPADWAPRPDDTRPVVVAIDDAFQAADLLGEGMTQARLHETSLQALHAWEMDDDRLAPEPRAIHTSMWSAELEERLRRQVEDLSDDVKVEVAVRHGVAADHVLEAADDAQLLVLGRNSVEPRLCHVGRTARSALRESRCPALLLGRAAAGGPVQSPLSYSARSIS